jgi:hypothetical protein
VIGEELLADRKALLRSRLIPAIVYAIPGASASSVHWAFRALWSLFPLPRTAGLRATVLRPSDALAQDGGAASALLPLASPAAGDRGQPPAVRGPSGW